MDTLPQPRKILHSHIFEHERSAATTDAPAARRHLLATDILTACDPRWWVTGDLDALDPKEVGELICSSLTQFIAHTGGDPELTAWLGRVRDDITSAGFHTRHSAA